MVLLKDMSQPDGEQTPAMGSRSRDKVWFLGWLLLAIVQILTLFHLRALNRLRSQVARLSQQAEALQARLSEVEQRSQPTPARATERFSCRPMAQCQSPLCSLAGGGACQGESERADTYTGTKHVGWLQEETGRLDDWSNCTGFLTHASCRDGRGRRRVLRSLRLRAAPGGHHSFIVHTSRFGLLSLSDRLPRRRVGLMRSHDLGFVVAQNDVFLGSAIVPTLGAQNQGLAGSQETGFLGKCKSLLTDDDARLSQVPGLIL